MNRCKLIFVVLGLAVIGNTWADVYKCTISGKTIYSDTPCVAGAKKIHNYSSRSPDLAENSETPITIGARVCRNVAPKHVAFKDPGSVQIGKVIGGSMDVIDYAGSKINARTFYVHVNAKNSYGGYVGEKPIICYTSEDGRRVIRVDDILL